MGTHILLKEVRVIGGKNVENAEKEWGEKRGGAEKQECSKAI